MWSKETDPRGDLAAAPAVEIELDPDLRFLGVALHGGAPWIGSCSHRDAFHDRAQRLHQRIVFPRCADRRAQATGQQRMRRRDVLDQDAPLLQRSENAVRIGHAEQQEIGCRRKHGQPAHRAQRGRHARPLGSQHDGLRVERRQVLEHQVRRGERQHVDVVWRTQLFDFRDPFGIAGQIAESDSGEAELGQRSQHEQVRPIAQMRHPGVLRERQIGLVDDDEPGRRAQHRLDRSAVEQVAGRIVRIRRRTHRGLVFGDRSQYRVRVEREIRPQRHSDEMATVETRRHLVHGEARPRRQHRCAGSRTRLDHEVDQLVRSVAQHQAGAERQTHRLAEPLLEAARIRHRITVQRLLAKAFTEFALHCLGQAERILHRIELDESNRARCHIGLGRAHVVAQHREVRAVTDARAHRFAAPSRRSSADMACAVSCSPRASTEATGPSLIAPLADTRITFERLTKS